MSAKTVSYVYDTSGGCSCGGGRLTEQDNPNGTATTFAYNNLGEPLTVAQGGGYGSEPGSPSPTWPIYALTRRNDGMVTEVERTMPGGGDGDYAYRKYFQYDDYGELSEEKLTDVYDNPKARETYAYDNNGNRTDRLLYDSDGQEREEDAFSYGTDNRMLSHRRDTWYRDPYREEWLSDSYTETPSYDGNGNQANPIGGSSAAPSTAQLTYYPDNRESGNGSKIYDGLGRLSEYSQTDY
jgi:hypothetical protein